MSQGMPGDKNLTEVTSNGVSDHDTAAVEEQEPQTQDPEHVKPPSDTIEIPVETIDAFGGDKLRARVFYEKYALRNEKGEITEKTPKQMWRRVAREIASPEEKKELRKQWEENFYWLLSDFKFIPGGRILFGAGQQRRATLLNCYYMPIKQDSIEGIFEWCKEAARTYSFGGGVGTDISILRPKGSPVNNSAIYSTGAVSFMDLLSTTTGTIGQAGRRGALMITIKVNHPDIIEFLDIKNDEARSKVQFANISVKVDDKFMEAVENDADYELSFSNDKVEIKRTVRARKIWEKVVRSAWSSAEPGLIFWDTVKKYSPTEYADMEVNGVNPCSEQALEDYGSCCLGNVNLSMFVKNAFEKDAAIECDELEKAFRYSVRFLDDILDYNKEKHPLNFHTEASSRSRRIGVGFTGLGDMLAKLNIKYDTDEGIKFTDELFEHIKNIVYEASSDLAKEKGTFPVFDLKKHITNPFVKSMRDNVMSKIKKQGLRNACILTVPPVGSGSVLAGTTSGVEPMFALSYLRRSESLSEGEFKAYHPLVSEYMEKFGLDDEADLPDTFVTSHEIKPELRVHMQAAIQKHIDSCISSTVNLPKDISLEEVEKTYFLSWKLGCKGVTVYREGSREGILITEEQAKDKEKPSSPPRDEGMSTTHSNLTPSPHPTQKEAVKPVTRPRCLEGFTEAIKTGYGNLYVTVNSHEGKPFEVFVQIGKSGFTTMADAEATGRLISLSLRSGVDVRDVVEQLEAIGGSSPVFSGGEVIMSVPDAIAKVLRSHFLTKEKTGNETTHPPAYANGAARGVSTDLILEQCPDCGSKALAFESGCVTCRGCGYSKCN